MREYHSIKTVWSRDPETKFKTLLADQWSTPEFEYLKNNEWVYTEKVDGTNIRVMFEDGVVKFAGKTDRAQMPVFLYKRLMEIFPADVMEETFDNPVCLYGEGYGAKIQKSGGLYRPDQSFVLFDVRIGKWWLTREDVEDIAKRLGIGIVPIIGTGTLDSMIRRVYLGFNSVWGDFIAEGIVARPAVELQARSGARIITKIKYKDFERTEV